MYYIKKISNSANRVLNEKGKINPPSDFCFAATSFNLLGYGLKFYPRARKTYFFV